MKKYTFKEIVCFNEEDIDNLIIGYKFEFEINSIDSDLPVNFIAYVIDQNLAISRKPGQLKIIIDGESDTNSKLLSILNIKSMTQIG
jgi:hypothetical protein